MYWLYLCVFQTIILAILNITISIFDTMIFKLNHVEVIKWCCGGTSYPSRSTLSCHNAGFFMFIFTFSNTKGNSTRCQDRLNGCIPPAVFISNRYQTRYAWDIIRSGQKRKDKETIKTLWRCEWRCRVIKDLQVTEGQKGRVPVLIRAVFSDSDSQ